MNVFRIWTHLLMSSLMHIDMLAKNGCQQYQTTINIKARRNACIMCCNDKVVVIVSETVI